MTKTRQLETELDMTNERYTIVSMQLEEKEKALLAAEAEMNALNRRVQALEKTLRRQRRNFLPLTRNLTRQPLPLMILSVQRKFSRTRLTKMKRGLFLWRRN